MKMRATLILPAIHLFMTSLFILITPLWFMPDEISHFEACYRTAWQPGAALFARDLGESLTKNHYWERRGIDAPAEFRLIRSAGQWNAGHDFHGFDMPLFHKIGALWLRLFGTRDIDAALLALRILSALVSTGTVLIACSIGRNCFGAASLWAVTAPAVIVCLPQFHLIGAACHPDNLVFLLGAAMISIHFKWLKGKITVRNAIAAGVFLVAMTATRRLAWIFLPITAGCILSVVMRRENALRKIVCVVIGSVLIFLGFLWMSAFFFPDLLARFYHGFVPETVRFVERIAVFGMPPVGGTVHETERFLKSFVFMGGYMQIALPAYIYAPFLALFFVPLFTRPKTRYESRLLAYATSSVAFLLAVVYFAHLFAGDVSLQGRYMFVLLPAIGWFVSQGWRNLIENRPILFKPLFAAILIAAFASHIPALSAILDSHIAIHAAN